MIRTYPDECACGGSRASPNPDCERCNLVRDLDEARDDNHRIMGCIIKILRWMSTNLDRVPRSVVEVIKDARAELNGIEGETK